MLKTTSEFRVFLTPCENYGMNGRDLYTDCWSFTYDRTS